MNPPNPAPRGRPVRRTDLFAPLQARRLDVAKAVTNGRGMRFVWVPSGAYFMGSAPAEPGHRANEAPQHQVALTAGFYLGLYPVTRAAYAGAAGDERPAGDISWAAAVRFAEQLSADPREHDLGRKYRLPTEAEWEYACRAGGGDDYSTGDHLQPDQAAFRSAGLTPDDDLGPPAVGQFPPNAFGLCDLHGGVWEWCADWYVWNAYATAAVRDPVGPAAGTLKVLRGGGWRSGADKCRAAYRNALAPHQSDPTTGFRLVLVQS